MPITEGNDSLAVASKAVAGFGPSASRPTPAVAGQGALFVLVGSGGATLQQVQNGAWVSIGVPTAVALTYATNGDSNGLVYYLGTNGRTTAFSNPAESGLTVVESGAYSGAYTLNNLTDRDGATLANTADVASSWWQWRLPVGASLALSAYTLRMRGDAGSHMPTAWRLDGSNNGTTWTVIDSPSSLTPAVGAYVLRTATSAAFSYFRLTQTAVTNSGSNYFIAAEVEFYGAYAAS